MKDRQKILHAKKQDYIIGWMNEDNKGQTHTGRQAEIRQEDRQTGRQAGTCANAHANTFTRTHARSLSLSLLTCACMPAMFCIPGAKTANTPASGKGGNTTGISCHGGVVATRLLLAL